jgi:hypothetical protein
MVRSRRQVGVERLPDSGTLVYRYCSLVLYIRFPLLGTRK